MSAATSTPPIPQPTLCEAALSAHECDLSVHPSNEDGTKAPWAIYPDGEHADGRPKWTWLHPSGAPADKATVEGWYGPRSGLGIRCGSESGGLECFEFDSRDVYEEFIRVAAAAGLGELVERIEAGYLERSPSGGVHWLYFADEVRGNTKLAKAPAPTETNPYGAKTLIETKGENGFIICAPSSGPVHPSGKPYVLQRGGFDTIITLTGEERDELWGLARSFDLMPKPKEETKTRGRPPSDGVRPGDLYEQQATWDDVLKPAGWTPVYSRGDETHWRRPDKSIGTSATTNYNGSGLLYVFTSSTVFNSEKSYTKFGAYAALNHGGNHTEAAKSLREQGYRGEQGQTYFGDAWQRRGTGTDGPRAESQPDHDPAPDDGPSDDVQDLWPVMDEAAYRGLAGDVVRSAEPHTEADPVAVLLQFLIGFANAVGHGPHWIAGATRHYLVLFAALVGNTATARKGQSWDVARYFLKMIDEEWALKRIMRGLSSGEGLIYHIRDAVKKWDDEGEEVVVDEGVKDKRMLCIESELGRTLKAMNRESSTLSGVLREAWDCSDQLSTLTKNSTNIASFPHFSLVGHITCEELDALLTSTDQANGLGNRVLWACVRRSKKLPHGGNFYAQDWAEMAARLQATYARAVGVGLMKRDEQADADWETAYDELTAARPGMLGSMLARAEAQVMRLACVYALLDGSSVVKSTHLESALAVWDYLEASARFIFGNSLGDPKAEDLLKALKGTPQGLTRSQISRDVFKGHMKKEALGTLLQWLLDKGLIHRVEHVTGKPGPKAELWFYGQLFRPRI